MHPPSCDACTAMRASSNYSLCDPSVRHSIQSRGRPSSLMHASCFVLGASWIRLSRDAERDYRIEPAPTSSRITHLTPAI
jgi:hypothetical protein